MYEVFLRVDPGMLCMLLLFGFCFILLLLVGVGKYVRNNCHLAANFGINSRVVFLGGIGLFFLLLERCEVVLNFSIFHC